MANQVDQVGICAFSGRQRNLWTNLNSVQKVMNDGGLTVNAIKIQMGILDEVKENSRELEIEMLIALEEDQLDAVEHEFDLIFRKYCELKTALLAWTSAERGSQGREEESQHVAVGNVDIVVDRLNILGSEFPCLKNSCASDGDLLALAAPECGLKGRGKCLCETQVTNKG